MLAGDDTEVMEILARSATPKDFAKRLKDQQAELSRRAEPLKIDEKSTPDQIAKYRKAMGLPEIAADATPDKIVEAYGIKPPTGYTLTPLEQGLVGEFAKMANAQHLPPSMVKAATDFFFKSQQSATQAQDKIAQQKAAEWSDATRKEFGRDYDSIMSASDAYLDQTFARDPDTKIELLNARLPGGGLLADHPAFVKMVADLAMQNGFTDRIEANSMESSGRSLADRKAEIMGWFMTDPDRYNQPRVQAELQKINQLMMSRGEIKAA